MAKKSHNAINIISIISVLGVMVGTLALIVILSVFNGFDNLVRSLINSFNPDLKVTLVEGKAFKPEEVTMRRIRSVPGVQFLSYVLEDKALVRYEELQTIAVVKGVSENYGQVTGLDSMMVDGTFDIHEKPEPHALIGRGISIYLNVRLLSPRQMTIYVPRRLSQPSFDANRALNRKYISVAGVFSIEQDYDIKYILVPLKFAQELFEYTGDEVNMLEIKVLPGFSQTAVQKQIMELLGKDFLVEISKKANFPFLSASTVKASIMAAHPAFMSELPNPKTFSSSS